MSNLTKTARMTFEKCPSCGGIHDLLSGSIPVSMPTEAARIDPSQRDERVWTNDEMCVVDDKRFYLYGSIEIPIHGHSEGFIWGAWAELDEETYFWYQDLLGAEGRETNAPFLASLGTDIPFYPPTLGLPLTVRIQPNGVRPLFVLGPYTHQLVDDQTSGISVERIAVIKQWFHSR